MADGSSDIRLTSVLDSVTVYSAGAVCRRSARLELSAAAPGGAEGPLRVVFTGLPLVLDQHSLRGRVLAGPAGLRVLDVRREVEAALPEAEDLSPLLHAYDEAEAVLAAARAAKEALAVQIEHISALRAVPAPVRRGDPPRHAPTDALFELADFVNDRLAGLNTRLFEAMDAVEQAEQQVEIARRRLQSASYAQPTERVRTTTGVVLTLGREAGETHSAGQEPGPELELELEYSVPGATWTPAYHLRLDGIDGDSPGGTLALRACVAQRTGEDWSGVRLGLSTADLRRRTDLPALTSLRIGRRQDQPVAPLWRQPPEGLTALFSGYDDFTRPAPQQEPGQVFRSLAAPMAVSAAAQPPAAPLRAARPGGQPRHKTALQATYTSAPAGSRVAGAFGAAQPQSDQPRSPQPQSDQQRSVAGHGGPPPVGGTAAGGSAARGEALRDLDRLELAGPEETGAERGQLRPAGTGPGTGPGGSATEFRRRAEAAEAVSGQALPPLSVPVRSSAGSFDYRYDAAAPVDVPADGAWHTVPVREFPVGLAVEHVCVPAADTRVYAVAQLRNTSANALLAGPAEVTVDGEFLLSTPLRTLAPGEQRQVGLGVVESIRVARRTRMNESTAGLRGGTTVLDHGVEIELANRLGRPVTVEVRERVPVSEDKDVRIEEKPASPPWTAVPPEQDDSHQRGMRRWRVALEPRSTTLLTAGYEIRIPVAKAVLDGNRRA